MAGHIVDPATGVELATATGVYVAAGAKQKQDLQERYAFKPADPDAGPDPTAPDR
jgi:hypothetical protein